MREYSPAKTGEYPARIFPNFQLKTARVTCLKDNKHRSLHLARIFVLGHYLSLETHSFRFSEQVMSADKYTSTFLRQMEAIRDLNSFTTRTARTTPSKNVSLFYFKISQISCCGSSSPDNAEFGHIRCFAEER